METTAGSMHGGSVGAAPAAAWSCAPTQGQGQERKEAPGGRALLVPRPESRAWASGGDIGEGGPQGSQPPLSQHISPPGSLAPESPGASPPSLGSGPQPHWSPNVAVAQGPSPHVAVTAPPSAQGRSGSARRRPAPEQPAAPVGAGLPPSPRSAASPAAPAWGPADPGPSPIRRGRWNALPGAQPVRDPPSHPPPTVRPGEPWGLSRQLW